MDYYKLYIILSFAIGLIGIGLGVWQLFLNEKNVVTAEKFCRNNKLGGIIWLGCLCWCVPHTEVIIFNFMVPYLWYMAIIVAILSYFFLDYLMSRALAGSFIICGYYLVHSCFDYHSRIAIIMSIVAWLIGIFGIVISAKPSYLRDILRFSSRNCKLKYAISGVIFVLSLAIMANGILELMK